MRFAITALGSSGGRTVGQVVDAVVRYLEPRTPDKDVGVPAVPSGEGPASYYADRGTEPGRWIGYGAREGGLTGHVLPRDFSQVLAGRDPQTGSRLITAQGSAGRRPTLGTGTETIRTSNGTRLYDMADLAAALGITHREAEGLVAAGERAAVLSVFGLLSGAPSTPEPAGSYVLPYIGDDGRRLVTEHELDRVEDARSRGTPPAQIAEAGNAADQFSVVEAARLSGVTARYMRRLCRNYEQNREEILTALTEGRSPTRAYVVAWRGTKGQWRIKRQDLVAFLERRHAPAVRVGFDLTLTTEKSLGVLALLGDDPTRKAVLDAIKAGNDTGLRYLETNVLRARAKGKSIGVRGWTAASFRHLTSRALDPFPHHHNVVANTVVDESGTRRALDARGLYRHAQEASALATVEMRFQLTNSLGVRWRPSWHGGWEIDGIDDAVVREFSRRRGDIDEAVAELEDAIGRTKTVDELQSIVLATRPAKEDADPAELVAGWWERAQARGLDSEHLEMCTNRQVPQQLIDEERIFEMLASPEDGLCAHSSMFTRSDVIVALADLPVPCESGPPQPLLLPATEVERLADAFLASEHAIPLMPDDLVTGQLVREQMYSTPEILAVQQRIVDRHLEGREIGAAMVEIDSLAAILDAEPRLSTEQRSFVHNLCTSGDRIQCAIGRAGSGKTTTMRVAAAAWQAQGLKVIGAAVKGEAARHLASGAEIPTETVAWFLARSGRPSLPLDDRTVLVIDEASTLSDRDLDALLGLAVHAGAAVRLIGDPAQHGAIAAGGMFRHLCELGRDRCPELTQTHRLVDPAERAAADDLRAGRIDKALARLDALGHLHLADDDVALYVGMLQRWWHARLDGDEHPMVDRRHQTRQQLNRLARQLLRATGQLGDKELSATRGRSFAAGDRVVARMAARHLHVAGEPDAYVRNGAVGTVVAVVPGQVAAGDRLRVSFDDIGTIDIPRGFFDDHEGPGGRHDVGIDHAYAVTSYAVQGATFGTSTSRIDEHASRSEAYVDITRGRATNHLFLTRAPEGLGGEQLPSVPPPPLTEAVSRRLRTSGPERAAIELDPDAALAEGETALRKTQPGSAPNRRARVNGIRAAMLARHDPPPHLVGHLPEPSRLPFLAQRRADVTAAIAAYRACWQPEKGTGPWAWALGLPGEHGQMADERARVVGQIVELSIATVREDLRPLGWGDLPTWAEQHVARQAASGTCRIDASTADVLYRKVSDFRETFGINEPATNDATDLTESMLGPRPDNPSARTAYQLLEHQIAISSGPRPGREATFQ